MIVFGKINLPQSNTS